MKLYFFKTTRSTHEKISELFDFVWPAVAAMWNFRKQVSDYLTDNPNAHDQQLDEHFTHPASIYGASLKSAWLSQSWESQQEEFAKMLLINIVAVYEGWIRDVLTELDQYNSYLAKTFQFSESSTASSPGIESALAMITSKESAILKQCFYDQLCRNKMHSPSYLEGMMICYCYFKELRNCEIHNGGRANRHLMAAYEAFTMITTPEQLGIKVIPRHHIPVYGRKTHIQIHGVAGLTSLVLRTIVTLDAELSRSAAAKNAFVTKWQSTHPNAVKLPRDVRQMNTTLRRLFQEADFPICEDPSKMLTLLQHFSLAYLPVKQSRGFRPRSRSSCGSTESSHHSERKVAPEQNLGLQSVLAVEQSIKR